MNIKRANRIGEEIRKIISELIINGLKDPRINPMTTVNNVEVTRDLSFAKIYVSVLGDEEEKKDTIDGLNSAKGFIRKTISSNLDLRYTPQPIFILDESIEEGIRMSKLIDEINRKEDKDIRGEDNE